MTINGLCFRLYQDAASFRRNYVTVNAAYFRAACRIGIKQSADLIACLERIFDDAFAIFADTGKVFAIRQRTNTIKSVCTIRAIDGLVYCDLLAGTAVYKHNQSDDC